MFTLLPHSSPTDGFFANNYEKAGIIIQGSHGKQCEKSASVPHPQSERDTEEIKEYTSQ